MTIGAKGSANGLDADAQADRRIHSASEDLPELDIIRGGNLHIGRMQSTLVRAGLGQGRGEQLCIHAEEALGEDGIGTGLDILGNAE